MGLVDNGTDYHALYELALREWNAANKLYKQVRFARGYQDKTPEETLLAGTSDALGYLVGLLAHLNPTSGQTGEAQVKQGRRVMRLLRDVIKNTSDGSTANDTYTRVSLNVMERYMIALVAHYGEFENAS